jgi:hypothetical protein
MRPQPATPTNYTIVPPDFPYEPGRTPGQRCLDWNVCEELALYLAGECDRTKAREDRSVRPVDILLKAYRMVEGLGWGEPPLLRWIFRRVAALLDWPLPDIAKQA